jgi:hypothetical protein
MLHRKFFQTVAEYQIIPYFCSPMKYLNKPSEKIIATESADSTTLVSLFPYIGGHMVDRLFFAENNKSNKISLCQYH